MERSLVRCLNHWTATERRRRLLFLMLAAPGFAGIVSTPQHQNPALLAAATTAFLAAIALRLTTEPHFARQGQARGQDPTSPPDPQDPHAP